MCEQRIIIHEMLKFNVKNHINKHIKRLFLQLFVSFFFKLCPFSLASEFFFFFFNSKYQILSNNFSYFIDLFHISCVDCWSYS
jgi:hypothetical protein